MIKFLFSIFLSILSLAVVGQTNFIPGYVVLGSGDTLVGVVNYKIPKKIALKCEFKKNTSDKVATYTPESAIGYGFMGGKQFISKDVQVDSGKTKKVFIEVLVLGKVSLYRFVNKFLVEKDKLYPLEVKTAILNSDVVKDGLQGTSQNMQYEQKKKTYIGILNYLFIDCPGISKELSDVNLNEKSLVNITKKYNKCVGAEYTVSNKKGKGIEVDLLATLGVNSNSMSFTTSSIAGFASVKDKSLSPTVSLGIQVMNRLEDENLSATVEVQFSNEKYSGSYGSESTLYQYKHEYSFKYSRIKISVGLKYKFSSGKVSPYVRLGAGFNIYTNGNLKTVTQQTIILSGQMIERNAESGITDFRLLDFWGSAGMQMSIGKVKAHLEIRGALAAGHSNNGVYIEDSDKALLIDPKSVNSKDIGLQIGFSF